MTITAPIDRLWVATCIGFAASSALVVLLGMWARHGIRTRYASVFESIGSPTLRHIVWSGSRGPFWSYVGSGRHRELRDPILLMGIQAIRVLRVLNWILFVSCVVIVPAAAILFE